MKRQGKRCSTARLHNTGSLPCSPPQRARSGPSCTVHSRTLGRPGWLNQQHGSGISKASILLIVRAHVSKSRGAASVSVCVRSYVCAHTGGNALRWAKQQEAARPALQHVHHIVVDTPLTHNTRPCTRTPYCMMLMMSPTNSAMSCGRLFISLSRSASRMAAAN